MSSVPWSRARLASGVSLAALDDLFTKPPLLLAQLGREILAEVLGLEHLTDLDDAVTILERVDGNSLRPLDRFLLGARLPEPESGDELFGLTEGAVDNALLPSLELDARALRARLQPFAGEHHPRLHQLFV